MKKALIFVALTTMSLGAAPSAYASISSGCSAAWIGGGDCSSSAPTSTKPAVLPTKDGMPTPPASTAPPMPMEKKSSGGPETPPAPTPAPSSNSKSNSNSNSESESKSNASANNSNNIVNQNVNQNVNNNTNTVVVKPTPAAVTPAATPAQPKAVTPSTPSMPTQMPNTGPAGAVTAFAGAAVAGTGLYYILARRRALQS